MTLVWITIDVILIQPPLKYAMSVVLHFFRFLVQLKLLLGKDITDSNVLFNNNDYFSLSSLFKLGSKQDKNNFFVLRLNTRSLSKNHKS